MTTLRTLPLRALALRTLPLAAAAAYFFAPASAEAANLDVCPSGCQYSTIQAAVDASSPGDFIDVGTGTYGRVLVIAGKDVTIEGSGDVTIDAGNAYTAMRVRGGGRALLRNVTVTGVSGANKNAGILNYGQLELDQVSVVDNWCIYGGIANFGDLSIGGNSLIGGNESSSMFAGGLNNIGGTAELEMTTIMGNEGWNGGGVSNLQGLMFISNTSISYNQGYLGGGIHNSFGQLYLEPGATFTSNDATSLGGGWSNHNLGGEVFCVSSGPAYANNSAGSGQGVDFYDVNGQCTQI